MKAHTQDFKENIKLFGRELSSKVTYTLGGQTIELGNENLNSVSPHYEGAILKSVMKQLDVDCDREIPEGTEINYQFGVKVRDMKNIFIPTLTADGSNISKANCTVTLVADEYSLTATGSDMYFGQVLAQGNTYTGNRGTLYEVNGASKIYLYCTNSTFNKNYITFYDTNKTSLGYNAIDNSKTNGKSVPANAKYFSIRFGYGSAVNGTTYKTKVMVSREPITEYETYGTTPYDYVNFGNYIVKDVEKQEDSNSWRMTCYDAMLNSMKDYENVGVTYPTTVRNYIIAICNYLGLEFANEADIFANCDKVIPNEMYLDSEGNSLGYTFRDVLDQLAEVTASTICINEDTNKLEIRYINELGTVTTKSGTIIEIDDNKSTKLDDFQVNGNTTQNGTPTPNTPIDLQNVTGRQEIDIVGKNLFTIGTGTSTRVTVDTTYNESEFLINGTTNNSGNIFYDSTLFNQNYRKIGFFKKGTYTVQVKVVSGTCTSSGSSTFAFYFRDDEQTNLKNIGKTSFDGYVGTLTLDEDKDMYAQLYCNGSGLAFSNYKVQIQVKRGEATSYEPYTLNKFQINLGKNLFGLVDGSYYANQVTAVVSNGEITLNGTANANAFIQIPISNTLNWINGQTYTISAFDSVANSNVRIRVNSTGAYDTELSNVNQTNTFTHNGRDGMYTTNIIIRVQNGTALNNFKFKPMLEKGSTPTSYSKYKTPIELRGLGNYKDGIKKSTGKNLFDGQIEIGGLDINTGLPVDNNTRTRSKNFIKVKPNTTYSITRKVGEHRWVLGYKADGQVISDGTISGNPTGLIHLEPSDYTGTFTTTATTEYIKWYDTNTTSLTQQVQIEPGSTPTDLEPYGVGKWFISRKICVNKADGDNSDSISYVSGNSDANYSQFNITKNKANWTNFNTNTKDLCKSNYFAYYSGATASGKTQSGFTLWNNGGTNFVFSFPTSMVTTGSEAASFRTWLTTHVVYAYGVAQFTSYEEINDSELIAQLNAIELYEGSNTISSISAGTNGELKISYFSDFETIDEEYLKDVNVNFGEQYGTINTIVLSRSAGSDNIYYPEILPENPVEIKISDNQIMNGDDRDTYMPDIYYRLNGLQYYLNDFSSTGITYFNLCDKYRVKIYDNIYPCIMFNDEVNVTQGLEENVYTEMPDEAETDYKIADTTDRKINQTTLQVNKQEGVIKGLVTTVETDSGRIDAVETTVTSQSAQINIMQTNINKDTGDIESVKTAKGYTFDDQGLEISSDEDEFSSLLSNTGAYYKVDGKTVSQITKDNTITKDMVLYGRYYYGVDVNLDVENFTKDDAMFVAEKYTDGNSEEGFGHFYNGLGG